MAEILDNGFEAIKDLFFNVNFFGFEWALSVIITIIVLLLISRNPQDWKQLALPVITLFGVMGFIVSPLVYVVAGFLFVFGMFNTRELGNLITTGEKTLTLDNIKLSNDELKIKNYSKILDDKELFKVAMDRNKGYQARKSKEQKEIRDKNLDFNRERLKTAKQIEKLKSKEFKARHNMSEKAYRSRLKEADKIHKDRAKAYERSYNERMRKYSANAQKLASQTARAKAKAWEREVAKNKEKIKVNIQMFGDFYNDNFKKPNYPSLIVTGKQVFEH